MNHETNKSFLIKNDLTLKANKKFGVFKILFDDSDTEEMFYYNVHEKVDNLNPSMPIFNELFNVSEGCISEKFSFKMVKKYQNIPVNQEKTILQLMKIVNEIKIFNLTNYIPKRKHINDYNSQKILDLKNKYVSAINYYTNMTINWIQSHAFNNSKYVIAVVPGHEKCDYNFNGISCIAEKLIIKFNFENGINLILRKSSIQKKSVSMYRLSLENDIKSLKINGDIDIKGKAVIILDDVTTTGNTFKACAYHLYKNGAVKVIPLAIGKTVINDV